VKRTLILSKEEACKFATEFDQTVVRAKGITGIMA
jgi:hypothetical protein